MNESGRAFVVKGHGCDYRQPFTKIDSADTSAIFHLDSTKNLYTKLQKLETNPVIRTRATTDAPRI